MASNTDDIRQTYQGQCHCGDVKFTANIPPLTGPSPPAKDVFNCNCTNCATHGLLIRHCSRKDVSFIQGFDKTSTYASGGKTRLLRFCSNCGTSIIFDVFEPAGNQDEFVGINVCAIQDVNLDDLHLNKYNGRAL